MSHIEEIKDELNVLKEIILENVPTDQIWLFGSYVYGTPHKDSDIDIYIVMKDDANMRETEAMTAVNSERCMKVLRPVDVLAMKKKRFSYRQGGRTLESAVVKRGIKIYG
ncbi:MAG: nucleotidyltransferase domain-containing protein [Chitinispirillales bacterium]|nr:nucleotidyltransferase domain-containing protein [Chitinispirillales bacterium]